MLLCHKDTVKGTKCPCVELFLYEMQEVDYRNVTEPETEPPEGPINSGLVSCNYWVASLGTS